MIGTFVLLMIVTIAVVIVIFVKPQEPISYLCVRGKTQIRVIDVGYLNQIGRHEWYFTHKENGLCVEESFKTSKQALIRVKEIFDKQEGVVAS